MNKPPNRHSPSPAWRLNAAKPLRRNTNRGLASVGPKSRVGCVELGSFHILELLGRGSFGEAYLTQQLDTDRRAVLKIAHAHLLRGPTSADVRRRFAAEVRAATRVSHPNLVTLFTSGETSDGLPAIAMEFIEGETLDVLLLAQAPLAGRQLAIFQQLASALHAIHQRGIVHRDVAPRNVMVGADHYGELRAILLDFGMAAIKGVAASKGPVGTPNFIAPEQLQMRSEPASDMFSLGALMWWALCCKPLVADDTGQPTNRPVDFNSAISPELDDFLLRLVHPVAAERPSAKEFMEAWPQLAASLDSRVSTTSLAQGEPPALSKPHMLVVDPNAVTRRMIIKVGERAGMVVSDRDGQGFEYGCQRLDAIVVSARCGESEIHRLLRYARGQASAAYLILATHGEETPWVHEFDTSVAAPGELRFLEQMLVDLVAQQASSLPIHSMQREKPKATKSHLSSGSLSRGQSLSSLEPQAHDRFIGVMPAVLIELSEAAEALDRPAMVALCARAIDLCRDVGAAPMQRVVTMYRELLVADASDDLSALVTELESTYQTAFRQLEVRA